MVERCRALEKNRAKDVSLSKRLLPVDCKISLFRV